MEAFLDPQSLKYQIRDTQISQVMLAVTVCGVAPTPATPLLADYVFCLSGNSPI